MTDDLLSELPVDKVKPTIVTVSATSSGTGTGGVLKQDGAPIIIKVIQPLTIIVVRASRVFLQTLVGLLAVGSATDLIPATDFLNRLAICASLSVASAIVCVIQNMIELLGRLDQSAPTLTV